MVILCVDNDNEDIEFFCEAAKEVDPSIIALSAQSGVDAINLLNSLETEVLPSYIFLDVNMPLMNGMETIKEIRKSDRYQSTQIVMLSTGLNPNNSGEFKTLGASHIMAKANSMKELRDKLTVLFKGNAQASNVNRNSAS